MEEILINSTNLELLQILEKVLKFVKWAEIEELSPMDLPKKYKNFNRDTLKNKEKIIKDETLNELEKKESRNYIIDLVLTLSTKHELKFNEFTKDFVKSNEAFKEQSIEFACFYWQPKKESNSTIGVNHIKITQKKGGKFECRVALFDKFPEASISPQDSTVDLHEENLIFHFTDSKYQAIQTQLAVYVGRTDFSQWSFLIGTYSSVGRNKSAHKPIAGVTVLQKVDNIQKSKEFAQNTDLINPKIYSYLYKTRVEANRFVFNTDELKTSAEIFGVKGYVGVYEGKVITSDRNTHKQTLELFYLLVKPNTEATLKIADRNDPDNKDGAIYHGRFRVVNELNRSVIAYFDYKDDSKIYRLSFYMNPNFYNIKGVKSQRLYGIYSAIESNGKYPIAGNILLDKISDKPIDINNDNKEYIPSKKDITENKLEKLFTDDDQRAFFTANHENNYIERYNKSYVNSEKSVEFGSGDFIILCLSSNQDSILRYPITIDGQTKEVRLKGKNGVEHIGKMEIGDRFLSITFINPNIQSEFGHKLFAIGDNSAKDLSIAYGVSNRIASNKPTARIELLLRSPASYQNEIDESYIIHSEEYEKFNAKNDNYLSYLTGKHNRLIVASDDAIPKNDMRREEKHGNLYFGSACYWANINTSQALEFLYQAYLHGFRDATLLEKEIKENGCLYHLYQNPKVGRPKKSQVEKLNCKQIIDNIFKWCHNER